MAYEKTKWVSGVTLLSAENFNKMEDGIEGAHTAAKSADNNAKSALDGVKTNATNISNLKEAFNNFIITFVGTREEYETANSAGQIPSGILVIITDEEEEIQNSSVTTAVLGTATLGSMILGQE